MAKAKKAKKAKKAPTKSKKPKVLAVKAPGGIKRKKSNGDEIAVPQFSLPERFIDGIAGVIVKAWNGDASLDKIMDRTPQGWATQAAVDQATAAINAAAPGFGLSRAVIISEEEHDKGYTMQKTDDEAVVFVLPNATRKTGAHLLDTAKLLMACTPNVI